MICVIRVPLPLTRATGRAPEASSPRSRCNQTTRSENFWTAHSSKRREPESRSRLVFAAVFLFTIFDLNRGDRVGGLTDRSISEVIAQRKLHDAGIARAKQST